MMTMYKKLDENHRHHRLIMSSFSAERIVRLVARSAMITMVLLSFPLLHSVIFSRSAVVVNDSLELQMLLTDLRDGGLFNLGDRAVFLGDSLSLLPLLKKNNLIPLSPKWQLIVPDHSVDFVVAADGFSDDSFGFIDRILRVGGIVATQLRSEEPVKLPENYRMVFMKRFDSTAIAVKKIAQQSSTKIAASRRLLAVPNPKQTTLDELEDVLLEPPIGSRKMKSSKRIRFLPILTGDSLDNYPRRVFIDVGPTEKADSENWFKKNYPRGKLEFEMVRLDVAGSSETENKAAGGAAAAAQGMSDWVRTNVKKEDYVVMKAEAGAVEELLQGKVIALVDELFLECKNQWFKGKKSKRAYWECLALYGRLRDEGVAVHQWWG